MATPSLPVIDCKTTDLTVSSPLTAVSTVKVIAHSARGIIAVIDKRSRASDVLNESGQKLNAGERARLQEIVYGAVRWYTRLDAIANQLINRPFRNRDRVLHGLLIAGLYQLEYMCTPTHAVVMETVSATRELKKEWAKGVINHCLREFQRQHDDFIDLLHGTETEFACPDWLVHTVQKNWPDEWQSILTNWNQRSTLSLRVNSRKITRDQYLHKLTAQDIDGRPSCISPDGAVLTKPMPVEQLPGFIEGFVSVQDEAAQLAALALHPKPGMRVLDACAAPGGKTCHLLEKEVNLQELVAVDLPERISGIEQNCKRLGLQAKIIGADAINTGTWRQGSLFDRILLDVPCTGTGVIRRHPDIKHQRREGDIAQLAQKQKSLLHSLWPLLDVGGQLLYVTCSILAEENEQVVLSLLEHFSDVSELPLPEVYGRPCEIGRQRLPGDDGADGFYYALLMKRSG